MTALSTSLVKARESYWLHLHKHGIGAHYVKQDMLDKPPPVGSRLLTIPQALARIGKATEGEAWKGWERNTLHFPRPVLAPKENLADLLDAASKTAPVKLPSSLTTSGGRKPYIPVPADYAERKRAWDEKEPERIAAANATIEQVSQSYQKWKDGAVQHAVGVAALHRAFAALANAISDASVQPWFFQPKTGTKGKQRSDWLLRPAAASSLVRFSRIQNLKGEDFGVALVPADELEAAFPASRPAAIIATSEDGWPLSPYLQLMMHVARQEGITAANHGTTAQLAAAICEAAQSFGLTVGSTGSDDLSPSMAAHLAKAIRWPGARSGNGKGANQNK